MKLKIKYINLAVFFWTSVLCNGMKLENIFFNKQSKQLNEKSEIKDLTNLKFLIQANLKNDYQNIHQTVHHEFNNRKKRSPEDIFAKAQEIGLNIYGKIVDAANNGVAIKDQHTRGVNLFGQEFEAGYNIHGGFGDVMNSHKVDDERKRRKKRSPCNRRPGGAATEGGDAEVIEEEGQRRRGRKKGGKRNIKKNISKINKEENSERRKRETSSEMDNNNNSGVKDKEVEETLGMVKKASEAVKKIWEKISDVFKKLEEKFRVSEKE